MIDWAKTLPESAAAYIEGRKLDEVECIISDLPGIARGKAVPASKFAKQSQFFLPDSIFFQTITGDWGEAAGDEGFIEKDMILRPDMSTATAAPWTGDWTLQVIHDAYDRKGEPVPFSPRNVLKHVVQQYRDRGLEPVVAPEMEFYLTKPNIDPNEPIEAPIGRTGRKSSSSQVYSMEAVDEYGPVIDTIYDFAEAQGLKIDTVIQEGGAGQIEINLLHGNPLSLADQVFVFKRTIREAALKNGIYATFMAKPVRDDPGSAMHIHQSVLNTKTGKNIFSDDEGNATEAFNHFIGGSQKYLMHAVPLLAPYVNSYRRITVEGQSAPSNLEWAADNRTTGLRVPHSGPEARRLENRVIGMDCNPYLAIAASLASGYLGMKNKIEPRAQALNEVWEAEESLPTSLNTALDIFEEASELWDVLGKEFCQLFLDLKRAENEEYQREISPWERQHLLLNV